MLPHLLASSQPSHCMNQDTCLSLNLQLSTTVREARTWLQAMYAPATPRVNWLCHDDVAEYISEHILGSDNWRQLDQHMQKATTIAYHAPEHALTRLLYKGQSMKREVNSSGYRRPNAASFFSIPTLIDAKTLHLHQHILHMRLQERERTFHLILTFNDPQPEKETWPIHIYRVTEPSADAWMSVALQCFCHLQGDF